VTPRLIAVGLSHRTAAIAQRERAALGDGAARATLRELLAGGVVSEAAVLSTCNRTELYAVTEDLDTATEALRVAHAAHAASSVEELQAVGRVRRDAAVVRHLFRVAASLDSMVVGEAEIQGQVRAARDLAADEGALGPALGPLFADALIAGRRARARTRVGAGAVSLSSVAVALARARLGDLGARRAALIGAGRMAQSTARALVGAGVGSLVVVSRSEHTVRSVHRRHAMDTAQRVSHHQADWRQGQQPLSHEQTMSRAPVERRGERPTSSREEPPTHQPEQSRGIRYRL